MTATESEITPLDRFRLYLVGLLAVHIMVMQTREPLSEGCHCDDCDPEMHADCTADCSVWDCGFVYACCNSDCEKT